MGMSNTPDMPLYLASWSSADAFYPQPFEGETMTQGDVGQGAIS